MLRQQKVFILRFDYRDIRRWGRTLSEMKFSSRKIRGSGLEYRILVVFLRFSSEYPVYARRYALVRERDRYAAEIENERLGSGSIANV